MKDLANLREKRKELGLTQTTLAREVGVSLMTIQLWERGAGKPNEENSIKLRKVLEKFESGRD